ncbi:hypothetical protein CVO76_06620 [Arthrobacter agilis]|jgi:hypothetical protein|uniref:Uncharacterized protein n=2 Tax=Arthrobacter agilis TaxID=37921 RepID=A0A2L0UDL8_9MICC|nr:hypothetical protein CVO76_06620 [Arthrobacter agilis]
MLVAGAAMLALCVAARRLGIGVGEAGSGPSLWLALLFIIGAALVLVVLVERLVAILRKR